MSNLDFARTRLQDAITRGRANGAAVIRQVLGSLPTDEITPVRETSFAVGEGATPLYQTRTGASPLSRHAFGQLMSRSGMPAVYAKSLLESSEADPWKGQLLEHNMRELLEHADQRYLVRRVGGQVRGVLSDCYRRLDSRPLLESFVGAANALGAVPVGGMHTETRSQLRCIVPTIVEPVPGEALVFGLNWGNSDFGAGTYAVSSFVLRLVCLNGMVGETNLKKVHIGARLADDLTFSDRTHALDQATLISATEDVVRALMAPEAIQARCARIAEAHAEALTFEQAWRKVGKQLGKGERDALQSAYEGPDTLNMPEGRTMWRFANALSWIANDDQVDDERRIDLQAMAGKLLAA